MKWSTIKIWLILVVCLFSSIPAIAQSGPTAKYLYAFPSMEVLQIDGVLKEKNWERAKPATDFIQFEPTPGQASSKSTEVYVLYDNAYIYFGAKLYDSRDNIVNRFSLRDDFDNTDFFSVLICPYRDGSNGFEFAVSTSNVQTDIKYSSLGQDYTWDAVWRSAVAQTDDYWSVEIRIPYSALRFPKQKTQSWDINFSRSIARQGEQSYWNTVLPTQNGVLTQMGRLRGVANIKPPLRLSFTPYVAAYREQYNDFQAKDHQHSYFFSGGMDIKYGINNAFTLDLTLIPDFGQVQADNEVLNLSPFEVRYNERRQFFTEGTELFNKADLFYSRRIGSTPIGYYDIADQLGPNDELLLNPSESQLLNAVKVSGRTAKGLGVGIFNAIENTSHATVRKSSGEVTTLQTHPLTNYNVLAIDHNLPNNSYISLINTSVIRGGGYHSAIVTGGLFELRDRQNNYLIAGEGIASQLFYPTAPTFGTSGKIRLAKISGNFLVDATYDFKSDTYNPNDLGFLLRENYKLLDVTMSYNTYEQRGKLTETASYFRVAHERRYRPDGFTSLLFEGETELTFQNLSYAGIWGTIYPKEIYDYYEPRTDGWYYLLPSNYTIGLFAGTNSRKDLGVDFGTHAIFFNEAGRITYTLKVHPNYRIGSKIKLTAALEAFYFINDVGYVPAQVPQQITFGTRNIITYDNSITATFIFNSTMGINMKTRYYWSRVKYKGSYFNLTEEGHTANSPYTGLDTDNQPLHDINFSLFNLDLNYRWRFLPGSELILAWQNEIFTATSTVERNFLQNIRATYLSPQINNFSIKVLYYIDALTFRKRRSISKTENIWY